MKNRTAEEILSFTFKHLETVLNGKSDDRDDFARKTSLRAEALYTQPKRGNSGPDRKSGGHGDDDG